MHSSGSTMTPGLCCLLPGWVWELGELIFADTEQMPQQLLPAQALPAFLMKMRCLNLYLEPKLLSISGCTVF